ncbi:MAG: DUF2442 domain-containing protein [Actinomycetota bacterium]|jgi:hypothetical protein|nr:DUF2442 domain-containing protein [Actinomycetota bacterium]
MGSPPKTPAAEKASTTDDSLTVELSDGRSISVPLAWCPRLFHGTSEERADWRVVGRGDGVHWPALDEDISVENLLAGQPSGESRKSLKRWMEGRAASAS